MDAGDETTMRAVILAGGRGARLTPYTTVLPKPLMPIGDLPVLEILIRRLRAHGIRQITLLVGYLAELMRAFCGDGSRWGVTIEYSYEKEPLGTAGPLRLLPDWREPLLVVNGDLLTDLDFTEFMKSHFRARVTATIGIYQRSVPLEFGIIEVSSAGHVSNYIEKPEHTYLVSMGAYILEPQALDMIPPRQRFDMPELVRLIISNGERVTSYLHKGYWVDIGRVEDYRQALDDFPIIKEQLLPDSENA
jgi:NDP-mannose synthase